MHQSMELPLSRGAGPPMETHQPASRAGHSRRPKVSSVIFLFISLLGLSTLVLRRVVILGNPTDMLALSTRELWAPISSYFLPPRKREASSSLLAELTDNLQAHLVIGIISGSNQERRMAAAQETWLTSMDAATDAVVAFSDQADSALPSIGLNGSGASWMGAQSRWLRGLSYLLHTYKDAEWYMIVDDDTFVVPRGLKAMLERHDSRRPLYLGRTMFSPPHEEEGAITEPTEKAETGEKGDARPMVPFAHGGSGVVLSRALGDALLPHLSEAIEGHVCEYAGYGDADLGYCVRQFGEVGVTHEACLHSDTPEAFKDVPDLFVKMSDLQHPCTFHYAFRGADGKGGDNKNSAGVNRMAEWQKTYNSEREEATEQ